MPLPKSCCLTPFVIPGEPRGTLEYHPGSDKRIKWYHAQPASVSHEDAALVLFYDVFGFSLPNSKILADEFADKLGIHVYVPNYLPNPPAIEPFLPITDLAPHSTPLTGLPKLKRTLQFSWAILSNLLSFVPVLDWFAYPKAKAAVDELKAKHAKLGVLGYCRGGAIAIRVASEQTPGVKCGMFCHPGPIDTKQWNTINVPTKWHLAKEDDYMKLEQIAVLRQLGKKKAKDGVEMTYDIHEGTTHGFASRPNVGYPPSEEAFVKVKADVGAFFAQHLVGP